MRLSDIIASKPWAEKAPSATDKKPLIAIILIQKYLFIGGETN